MPLLSSNIYVRSALAKEEERNSAPALKTGASPCVSFRRVGCVVRSSLRSAYSETMTELDPYLVIATPRI